jgi:hypothetical protein
VLANELAAVRSAHALVPRHSGFDRLRKQGREFGWVEGDFDAAWFSG